VNLLFGIRGGMGIGCMYEGAANQVLGTEPGGKVASC